MYSTPTASSNLLVRHTALLRRLSSHSVHSTHFPFSNRFLEVTIRKAAEADIDAVTEIYDHIHDEEESGSIGWRRGAYPVRATAETAVSLGELFVLEYAGARRG